MKGGAMPAPEQWTYGTEERTRVWGHRLHEDSQLNERLNFFLIAEAMLVVAAAQVLTSDSPRPLLGVGISVVGLGLTLAWMYVDRRQFRVMRHVHEKAVKVLPEFREHEETKPRARPGSTQVLCYGIPGIMLVVWLFFLPVSIVDAAG